jgi:hypothetical protein
MRQNLTIGMVLARRDEVDLCYEMSMAEARALIVECIAGRVVTGEAGRERIACSYKNLKEPIDTRGMSFYHVRLVPPNQNTALICAQSEAQRLASDSTLDILQRTKATDALRSDYFLWFGALPPCILHT